MLRAAVVTIGEQIALRRNISVLQVLVPRCTCECTALAYLRHRKVDRAKICRNSALTIIPIFELPCAASIQIAIAVIESISDLVGEGGGYRPTLIPPPRIPRRFPPPLSRSAL